MRWISFGLACFACGFALATFLTILELRRRAYVTKGELYSVLQNFVIQFELGSAVDFTGNGGTTADELAEGEEL